jgi:hypothetical protein
MLPRSLFGHGSGRVDARQAIASKLAHWLLREPLITPWPKSASELYRPSDRRLSAKLVPTFCG